MGRKWEGWGGLEKRKLQTAPLEFRGGAGKVRGFGRCWVGLERDVTGRDGKGRAGLGRDGVGRGGPGGVGTDRAGLGREVRAGAGRAQEGEQSR